MKNLLNALARAKSEIKKITKDGTNPHFRSRYATLENVIEGTSKELEDQKISILQFPEIHTTGYILRTVIFHESGETLESIAPLPVKDANDPQKLGSAISYMRRYTLISILNLIVTDDDGNAASEPVKQQYVKKDPVKEAGNLLSEEVYILKMLGAKNSAEEGRILSAYGVTRWEDVVCKDGHYSKMVESLKRGNHGG